MNSKNFERFDKSTMIMIEEGSWEHLQEKPEFKAKKQADKVSYGWDIMISRTHETALPEYEKIAREMARLN